MTSFNPGKLADGGGPQTLGADLDALKAQLAEISSKWLHLCGSCDAGLPYDCSCPSGDPRSAIQAAVDVAERAFDLVADTERRVRADTAAEIAQACRAECDRTTGSEPWTAGYRTGLRIAALLARGLAGDTDA